MADFRKSFMGACSVAGCEIAATSMSCGLEIKPGFYDHIFGKRDTFSTPKGPGGQQDKQKTLWRYLPGVAKLSASGFPMGGIGDLWAAAKNAVFTGGGILFSEAGPNKGIENGIISSLTIDARAGEYLTVSVELTGINISGGGVIAGTGCALPIPWSAVSVSSGLGDAIGFSVTITNPIKPVYTSSAGFFADELRVGIQEITGSVTTVGGDDWKKEGAIDFSINCGGGGGGAFDCIFEGSKYSGDPSGIWIATTNFYGHQ